MRVRVRVGVRVGVRVLGLAMGLTRRPTWSAVALPRVSRFLVGVRVRVRVRGRVRDRVRLRVRDRVSVRCEAVPGRGEQRVRSGDRLVRLLR